jgi:hypothetical protein
VITHPSFGNAEPAGDLLGCKQADFGECPQISKFLDIPGS